MKCTSTLTVCFLFFASFAMQIQAQELQQRDRVAIRMQAMGKISELEGLLNLISDATIFPFEIERAISVSYDNQTDKLFVDAEAVVEDDLDPKQISPVDAKNISAKTYLYDFDLMYEKSEVESVKFSEIKVSKVQQKEYVFVQVYFKRKLGSKSKRYETPFEEVERLAEIKATRKDGKWETNIASIVFFDDKVPFEEYVPAANLVSENTDNPAPNSNFYEVFDEDLPMYEQVIEKADQAFEEEKYTEAMEGYLDARSIKPYYSYPIKMYTKAKELADKRSETSLDQQYFAAIKDAEQATKRRDYQAAKTAYTNALALKGENPTIRTRLREVDDKLRLIAEIQSKYVVGDYKQALKDFQRASKKDPTNPEYYLGIGKCHFMMRNKAEELIKSKEVKKALKNYDKAIELDNNFLEALATRAKLYEDMGQYPKAISDIAGMLSNEPENSGYYLLRALTKIRMNDQQGAMLDFASAIKFDNRNEEAFYQRGLYQYQLKAFNKAKIDFDSAISISPRYKEAFFQRGFAALKMQNYALAAADFEKSRSLGIDAQKVTLIANESTGLYQYGIQAYEKGDMKQAADFLTYAADIYPENHMAWFYNGIIHQNDSDYPSAIHDFEMAFTVKSDYLEAFQECGNALYAMEEYERAFSMYKKAYTIGVGKISSEANKKSEASQGINATNLLSLTKMGDTKFQLADFTASYQYYTMALDIDGNAAMVLNKAGRTAYELGQYDDALGHLKKSIEANQHLAEAYYHRGLVLAAKSEYDKAVLDYDMAMSKGFKLPEVYYASGFAYEQQGNYQSALANYSQAIALQPTFTDAYWGKAGAAIESSQYQEAMNALYKYGKLYEGELPADYYYRMGFSAMNLKEVDVAEEFYKEALAVDKQHPEANLRLGCLLLNAGNKQDAYNCFELALRTGKISKKFLKEDEQLIPLKKDKEFKKLIKKYL